MKAYVLFFFSCKAQKASPMTLIPKRVKLNGLLRSSVLINPLPFLSTPRTVGVGLSSPKTSPLEETASLLAESTAGVWLSSTIGVREPPPLFPPPFPPPFPLPFPLPGFTGFTGFEGFTGFSGVFGSSGRIISPPHILSLSNL